MSRVQRLAALHHSDVAVAIEIVAFDLLVRARTAVVLFSSAMHKFDSAVFSCGEPLPAQFDATAHPADTVHRSSRPF
jgi:hypothetical protein